MNTKSLKPTLWRTARALANEDRLRLFKAVAENDDRLCVMDYAKMLGIPVDVASVYLRQMNARGLLGVSRSYIKVYYNLKRDRSLPQAMELQSALVKYVSGKLEKGWEDRLVRIFKSFTHFNRLAMIVRLAKGESVLRDLNRAAGVIVKSSYHHLRFLAGGGIIGVKHQYHAPDVFTLLPQTDPIAQVLLKQTLEGVAGGEKYYNPPTHKLDEKSKAALCKIRREENATRENFTQRRGNGISRKRMSPAAQEEMERE